VDAGVRVPRPLRAVGARVPAGERRGRRAHRALLVPGARSGLHDRGAGRAGGRASRRRDAPAGPAAPARAARPPRPAGGGGAGAAALHRRRRRVPELRRGAALRGAARPARALGRPARLVLVLPVAGRVRPRAAAHRADRGRRPRLARGVRPRPVRAGRAGDRPHAGGPSAAGSPAPGARPRPGRRCRVPGGRAAGQGAHREGRHLPGRALRARARPPARSIRSTSTARCAW
jgi:hypothetical protein